MNCNDHVVTITKIVNGGYGLAKTVGDKTLFVRFGLPGETVSVALDEERKRFSFGHVVEVLEPGPGRLIPPCAYYGRCGGCNFQHADYQTQCLLKESIITELFSRSPVRDLSDSVGLIKPLIGSTVHFGYRQRIRLKINEKNHPGFTHFRSHNSIEISRCLLAAEPINACLAAILESKEFKGLAPIMEELEIIFNPLTKRVSLLFSLIRPPRPTDRNLARSLCAAIEVLERVFFSGQNFALDGPYCDNEDDENRLGRNIGFRLEGDPPMQLFWEIGGFSQVNLQQNARLIEVVRRLVQAQSDDRILDLYCGMGNLSVPLAGQVREVQGIEGQGSAIRSAISNAAVNNLSNCRFSKSDVTQACRSLAADREIFDTVICDPPRKGMADLVEYAAQLARKRIVYISCDPATLCRDLERLVTFGLTIKEVQPLDMFPQTHHIETVVLLEKSPAR